MSAMTGLWRSRFSAPRLPRHWRDPVTAGELKLAVKRILGLE